MTPYKKLMTNSAIFAVGQLGSKIISFVLVPLYTYYLSTMEFGTIDLVTTTVSMLLPIVSGSVYDAVLRFTMDEHKYQSKSIVSNSLVIVLIGFSLMLLIMPLMIYFDLFKDSTIIYFLYAILFLQIIEKIIGEFTRAKGYIKDYTMNGMLLTFCLGIFNILFLVGFEFGIYGYFLAMVSAYLISVIFLSIKSSFFKYFELNAIDLSTIKLFALYSIPLMPNTLLWWLINASSRYFILFYIGIHGNGLFAVASKIPAILNIITTIFSQAWQLSAIEEHESSERSSFYSKAFNYYTAILFIVMTLIIAMLKPLFKYVFAKEYYLAWQVVPFLLLGTVFFAFSAFLGTNYLAAKQTSGVLKTSVIGGIVSLIINVTMIPSVGIIGAGISSMISSLVIWMTRVYDTKRYVEMFIDWKKIYYNIFLFIVQIVILFIDINIEIEMLLQFFIIIVSFWINNHIIGFVKENIIQLASHLKNK